MKLILLLAMLAVVTLARAATNAVPSSAEQEQMFMEAVMLSSKGFYAEAEVQLKKLVELQPEHPTLKKMLAEVRAKLQREKDDPLAAAKQRLEVVVIPKFKVREAKLEEVIARLEDECFWATGSHFNCVTMPGSASTMAGSDGTVTLNLEKVPLTDVLRYVTQALGLAYRIEAHAVVIYKPEPVVATPNVKPE